MLGLSAAVRADPGLLLRRTREAIDGIGAMEGAGEEDILRAASASVGVSYVVAGLADPGANATVIRVGVRPDGYVCWDGEDPAAAIVAQVVATTLGRVRAAAREAEAARERALLALLGAKDTRTAARRARHEGVPVDGWHVAVFLRDPGGDMSPGAADPVLREVRGTVAAWPGALGAAWDGRAVRAAAGHPVAGRRARAPHRRRADDAQPSELSAAAESVAMRRCAGPAWGRGSAPARRGPTGCAVRPRRHGRPPLAPRPGRSCGSTGSGCTRSSRS